MTADERKRIEDNPDKLKRLFRLLDEYEEYIRRRERQPLAGQTISLVKGWVRDNSVELERVK